MEYEHEASQAFNFLAGIALGTVLGAGAMMLTAPQSGRRTRRRLRRAAEDARFDAGERLDEWSDDVRSAVRSKRRRFDA